MNSLQVKVIVSHRDKFEHEMSLWTSFNPLAEVENVSMALTSITVIAVIFYRTRKEKEECQK